MITERLGAVAGDAKGSIRLEPFDRRTRLPLLKFRFDWKFPSKSEVPENASHAHVSVHDSHASKKKKVKVIEILRISLDNARS